MVIWDKYKYWDDEDIEEQAKHLVENCLDLSKHKINKFIIFNFKNYFEVVDSENYTIICFRNEEDALNYCLDEYKYKKERSLPKQLKLDL